SASANAAIGPELRIGDHLGRSFADRLSDMTARAPVVLVLEDLHWSTRTTLESIRTLVEDSEQRLFVLMTARTSPDDGDVDDLERILPPGAPTRSNAVLDLGGIGRDKLEVLVQLLMPELRVDLDDVVSSTGGNPFLVRELLHMAQTGRASVALEQLVRA